jgi:TRAP-type C4-dicarboxylate transport system permease small subunit
MDKALAGLAPPGAPFLERFERFNGSLATLTEAIALAALVFMVLVTCIDVAGAKLFLRPVPGSLDMMMMAQLVGVAFGAASTLLQGRHVAVEFFVALLPKRLRAAVAAAANLASLVLFVLVAWRLLAHGAELQSSHEVTPTAYIPIAPFAYAAGLAIVPLCFALAQHFLQNLSELRNES